MSNPFLTTEQFTYVDTQANIEALTGLVGGERGYATDRAAGQKEGYYDSGSSAWVWGGDLSEGGTGGVVGRVAEFVTDDKTLQAAALIAPASNILTLTNAAAATLALNITAGKTLTLTQFTNGAGVLELHRIRHEP